MDRKSLIEAVGSAAVVLSLMFVGLEVNESTRATRSATAAETTATIAEWYTALGSDEQVASMMRDYITDPQSLTREERFQATMNFHALMLILQSSFYLEEEGTLTPQIRQSMTKAITSEPGVHFYWEQRKPIFVNEGFIAFMEQTLASDYTHSKDLYQPRDDKFVSLPPTVELALVVASLTDLGRERGRQIDRSTPYYSAVEAHFRAHADMSAVASLAENFNLPRLAGNAADFAFDQSGRIVETDRSGSLWKDAEGDLFRRLHQDLEAFAKASGFSSFYEEHRDDYAVLIDATNEMVDLHDMRGWLEAEFSARPGPARIFVSPLMAGLHWTTLYKSEQRIWLKAPDPDVVAGASALERMRFARSVFTEVDHAYVNPVTAMMGPEIATAFGQTERWATTGAAANYPTAELQFNEYMTWAVFLLYAAERLTPEDFVGLKEETVSIMVKGRGFRAFDRFADQAMALHKTAEGGGEAIIADLIAWARNDLTALERG
jgi:hypothetical protein